MDRLNVHNPVLHQVLDLIEVVMQRRVEVSENFLLRREVSGVSCLHWLKQFADDLLLARLREGLMSRAQGLVWHLVVLVPAGVSIHGGIFHVDRLL